MCLLAFPGPRCPFLRTAHLPRWLGKSPVHPGAGPVECRPHVEQGPAGNVPEPAGPRADEQGAARLPRLGPTRLPAAPARPSALGDETLWLRGRPAFEVRVLVPVLEPALSVRCHGRKLPGL